MVRLNNTLPTSLQLGEDDMRLDATLQDRINDEVARRVAEARKEYVVESARGDVLTRKLRRRFVDNLLFDRFVLHSFKDTFQVSSFRTPDPAEAIHRLEANIAALESEEQEILEVDHETGNELLRFTESRVTNDSNSKERAKSGMSTGVEHINNNNQFTSAVNNNDTTGVSSISPIANATTTITTTTINTNNTTNNTNNNNSNSSKNNQHGAESVKAAAEHKVALAEGTSTNAANRVASSSVRHHLSKLDQRREERRIRHEEEKMLIASAPDPALEDAALRTRIANETLTRGECVLRTQDHYQHSYEFRPSASAKLRRMIEAEQYLVSLRSNFNKKLIALRERKEVDLAKINALRASIASINKELNDFSVNAMLIKLGEEERAFKETFVASREALDAFEERKELERQQAEEAKKAQRGFGADLAGAAVDNNNSNTNNNNNNNNNSNTTKDTVAHENALKKGPSSETPTSRGWVSRSIQSHPRVSMSVTNNSISINAPHCEVSNNTNNNNYYYNSNSNEIDDHDNSKRQRTISFHETSQLVSGPHDDTAEHESWENTNASTASRIPASHTQSLRHTLVPATFVNSLANNNHSHGMMGDARAAAVGHEDVNNMSFTGAAISGTNTMNNNNNNNYNNNINNSLFNNSSIHMMSSLASNAEHDKSISLTKASFRGSRRMSRMDRGSRQSTVFLSVNRERMDVELRTKLENIKLTEAEEEEKKMNECRLRSERQRLLSTIDEIMSAFDKELEQLRILRAKVDVDVCLVQNKLLLLFREYQLLLVYRERDASLRGEFKRVRGEREQLHRSLSDITQDIGNSEVKLISLQERLRLYKRKVESYIRENSPPEHVGYLLKVFYRHIKRRRRREDNEADDDDDITSSDDDDDNDNDNNVNEQGEDKNNTNNNKDNKYGHANTDPNDEADDDNIITEEDVNMEEICPPACSAEIWNDMLRKREGKLDLVDAIADLKLHLAQARRTRDESVIHSETLHNKLQEVRNQIDQLAIEKRRELNKLTTVIPLRQDQICYGNENNSAFFLSTNFSEEPIIIIRDSELERIRLRINQLEQMKCNEETELNNMFSELAELQIQKNTAQKVYKEWQDRVDEVMLLKFGQRVDLDYLESCGTSWRIEEKKEELRQRELYWERMCRMYQRQIASIRSQMNEQMQVNTSLLHSYEKNEEEHQEITQRLELATSKTMSKFKGTQIATPHDRVCLRELIAAQREEMDALRTEIAMLRRKGGHAYDPSIYEME